MTCRQQVKSSNIASVGWAEGMLEVEFKHGGIYRYMDVPFHIYREMMSSESVGQYFHRNIKDKFMFQKVEDAA